MIFATPEFVKYQFALTSIPPLLQRRITNPMSDRTPAPGSALQPHPHQHPHPHRPPTYRARIPLRGLPSGQTTVRGLLLLLLEQLAAVQPPVIKASRSFRDRSILFGLTLWSADRFLVHRFFVPPRAPYLMAPNVSPRMNCLWISNAKMSSGVVTRTEAAAICPQAMPDSITNAFIVTGRVVAL